VNTSHDDPELAEQLDRDLADRQAGMDHVDQSETLRRAAAAQRRNGADA